MLCSIGSRWSMHARTRRRGPIWTAVGRKGKSWKEAVRALKRFILRAVWRFWQRCLQEENRLSQSQ